VLSNDLSQQAYNLGTEPQRQQRQQKKPYKSPRKNSGKKIAKAHFKNRSRQHKNFEWHWRRQHARKHQRPEFVLLK
jgi:hypothetical protein